MTFTTPLEDQILDAVVTKLKTITATNGYYSTLLSTSVRRGHQYVQDDIYEDGSSFPLIFVNTGRATKNKMINRQKECTLDFPIVFYVRVEPPGTPDTTLIKLTYDIERALESSNTASNPWQLPGSCKFDVIEANTDEGLLAPLAVCVMRVQAFYRYYPEEQKP